mmetsp:Transcript_42104/g.122158  ORF Transcript_42104/g.122158 Transcript_42104/m.122158 type:complete len:362 (-) Transcript_42104:712-1797(-)
MYFCQGYTRQATTAKPKQNFVVRGCRPLSWATAVTAPSKLCSHANPTNNATAKTICWTRLAMVPVASWSAILSRYTIRTKATIDNAKAKRMRALIVLTSNPRRGCAIQAQRKPHMKHHAKHMKKEVMMRWRCSATPLRSSRPSSLRLLCMLMWSWCSSSPCSSGMHLKMARDVARKAPPAAHNAKMWTQVGVKLSSSPSSFGRMPVIEYRTTCTSKKDTVKAMMSFSASLTCSAKSCARWPGRALFLEPSSHFFLMMELPRNAMSKNALMMKIGRSVSNTCLLKNGKCCMQPPTAMAAKPPQCARSVAQHRFKRLRFSRSYLIFLTAISMPLSSSHTLFLAVWSPRETALTFSLFSPKGSP